MKAGKADIKVVLENIFRTMEYNGNEVEDFSPILKWLANKKFSLESTISGVTSANKEKFSVLNNEVTISLLDSAKLEKVMDGMMKIKESPKELGGEEKDERLQKLRKILGDSTIMSLAESIASQVPTWQIKEHDKLNWTSFQKEEDCQVKNAQIVFFQLNRQGYSTTARIVQLLKTVVQSDKKILIILDMKSSEDLPCLLPATLLVEEINKSTIRNSAIDIVYGMNYLDVLNQANLPVSYLLSTSSGMLLSDIKATLLISGVITRSCSEKKVHYIVDSSADIPATVEAITHDMWKSGTKINYRTRATMFVHQSVQQQIIDEFCSKLTSLKVSTELVNKSLDFIKRISPSRSTEAYKTLFQQGIKTIPSDADGSEPTLIYNVGTSSKFLTGSGNHALGHLLFVIPYRTVSELFSLANVEGENTDVLIYCSNTQIVKQITTGISGSKIMINQTLSQAHEYKCFREHFQNTLYQKSRKSLAFSQGSGSIIPNPAFKKVIEEARKNFKDWSSLPIATKLEWTIKLLESAKETIVTESDMTCFMRTLVKYTLSHKDQSGFSDPITWAKPLGVSGLIVLDDVPLKDVLMSILLPILKGNVVVVTGAVVDSFKKIFETPEFKAVQFVGTSTTEEGIKQLSQTELIWVLHPDSDDLVEQRASPEDFGTIQKLIVSNVSLVIESNGLQLEVQKSVYL